MIGLKQNTDTNFHKQQLTAHSLPLIGHNNQSNILIDQFERCYSQKNSHQWQDGMLRNAPIRGFVISDVISKSRSAKFFCGAICLVQDTQYR